MKRIELLAPAGTLECGKAAVDCGADAVYMGAPRFGARQAAGNSIDDVARMVEYAKPLGVRVYATLNTLVCESELRDAETVARELASVGVDALIVQDMAFMEMDLGRVEMHASTQTTNITPERVRFLEQAGFSRVILERGLSLDQIKSIRAATNVDIECFVHGAICVGFSGICYLSRSMGPRSGNRGDCSQPCRLTYDLEDGRGQTLVKGKHLLSVRDLDLSCRIGDLLDAGVSSFKIEGRLKGMSYVRNATLHYNRILNDELARREGLGRSSPARVAGGFATDLHRSYSRGGSVWMLDGKRAGVASPDTPKAAGVYIGEVKTVSRGVFSLKDAHDLTPGDGICFMAEGELRGTNVNRIEGRTVTPNRADGIAPGTRIYRNYDKRFEDMVSGARTRRVIDATALVSVSEDRITMKFRDIEGVEAEATADGPFDTATSPAKMLDTIRDQTAKSGDTIFAVREVEIASGDALPFIPVSVLNGLRREALESLRRRRAELADARRMGFAPRKPERSDPQTIADMAAQLSGNGLNVINSLARRFYLDRGVEPPAEGYDVGGPPPGATVMTSPYCLRRELGACRKDGGKQLTDPLYLRRGRMRYRLDFDCAECLMKIINDPE